MSNKKRLNLNDNFEDLYLRCDRIKKINTLDSRLIEPYKVNIVKTSKLIYKQFYVSFNRIGFELDDIISICTISTITYLQLFSIKHIPACLDRLQNKKGRAFTQQEIEKYDISRLISFLKQELTRCAYLGHRKLKNIYASEDPSNAVPVYMGDEVEKFFSVNDFLIEEQDDKEILNLETHYRNDFNMMSVFEKRQAIKKAVNALSKDPRKNADAIRLANELMKNKNRDIVL